MALVEFWKQAHIPIGPRDNFATYYGYKLASACRLFVKAIDEALDGGLIVSPLPGYDSVQSHLYHHPTLWSYLTNLKRGIR